MNTDPSTAPAQPSVPEKQNVQPVPNTEVNPGRVGNETELDLDREKVKTYPKTHPPERH